MSHTYPFEMKWDTYCNAELLEIACSDLSSCDWEDMVSLVRTLALRLERIMNARVAVGTG